MQLIEGDCLLSFFFSLSSLSSLYTSTFAFRASYSLFSLLPSVYTYLSLSCLYEPPRGLYGRVRNGCVCRCYTEPMVRLRKVSTPYSVEPSGSIPPTVFRQRYASLCTGSVSLHQYTNIATSLSCRCLVTQYLFEISVYAALAYPVSLSRLSCVVCVSIDHGGVCMYVLPLRETQRMCVCVCCVVYMCV